MPISLLDCDRTDRYEFELFISDIRFKDEIKTNNDVTSDCGSENEETHIDELPKLAIIATLGNAIEMNITNQEKDETHLNTSCLQTVDDGLNPKDSLVSIVDQLANRYTIEGTPVGNIQNVCYTIRSKEPYAKHPSRKSAFNKGMSCVFSSVPRKFITTLQMNPLELSIREFGNTGPVEIGKVCIPLYGHNGFTEAVAHHFYEKGYAPYSHSVERMFDVRNKYDKIVGQMTIRLKLTCHGPQTREINPLVCQPDKEKVSPTPIFVKENAFDFPSEKRECLPKSMITYIDVDNGKTFTYPKNNEIRKYLRCQKFQELAEKVPERCPCLTLLDQFKKIIYQNDTTAITEPTGMKTVTREQGGLDTGHSQCPCPKMLENRVSGQNIGNNYAHVDALQIGIRKTSKDDENKFSCICNKLYGSKEGLSEMNGVEESSDPVRERGIEHLYGVPHTDETTIAPASLPSIRKPEIRNRVANGLGTKKKKKGKKVKKSCRSNAFSSGNDSVSMGSTTFSKDINKIARNLYPGVNCGHKECIQCPVVVPKNMGWLWTIGKSGNIRFNRRWKPGGIQREVVALIEAMRNGKDPEEAITVKSRSVGTKRSNSQAERFKPETTQSESSFRQTRPFNKADNQKASTKMAGDQPKEVPTLMVHKHNGQYMFQMNPLPEQDEVGNYVLPDVSVDPVQIRIGRRDRLNELATSESSIDLELVTPKTFAAMKPNKVNKNIQSKG